jgi:transposase
MLSDSGHGKVYLACGATDLRKSIDGLAALVQAGFDLDPFSDAWFVFCNRDRDKLKLLRWDHNGFWLYYRRLERGRFQWPRSLPTATCELRNDEKSFRSSREASSEPTQVVDRRQLAWLLDGLNLEQKRAHKPVTARSVV